MTFMHKLSARLALMKDRVVAVSPALLAAAVVFACERPVQLTDTGSGTVARSEEHTSELQSQSNLVCRLLLEKKKKKNEKVNNRSKDKMRKRYGRRLTGDDV